MARQSFKTHVTATVQTETASPISPPPEPVNHSRFSPIVHACHLQGDWKMPMAQSLSKRRLSAVAGTACGPVLSGFVEVRYDHLQTVPNVNSYLVPVIDTIRVHECRTPARNRPVNSDISYNPEPNKNTIVFVILFWYRQPFERFFTPATIAGVLFGHFSRMVELLEKVYTSTAIGKNWQIFKNIFNFYELK